MELLLIDSQPIHRHYWRRLCEENEVTLNCFDAIPQALLQQTNQTRVIILDQSVLPDFVDEAPNLLARTRRDVVAFSFVDCSITAAVALMRQGASWLFDHSFSSRWETEFRELIQIAESKNELLQRHHKAQECIESLTASENDVLKYVLTGLPNKTVAKLLEISVRTVEARRARVYRKCNVRTVTELVRFVDGAAALRERFETTDESPATSTVPALQDSAAQ